MNPRHPPTECCAYAQAAADYKRINADHTSLGGFDRHIRPRRERASQFARDSLLEGNGFEISVPRKIGSDFEASVGLRPIDRRRGGIIRAVVGLGKPIELFRRL